MKTMHAAAILSAPVVLAWLMPADAGAGTPCEAAATPAATGGTSRVSGTALRHPCPAPSQDAVRSADDALATTKLAASDGSAGDSFGRVVAIDDDRLVAGAYLDDDAGADSGSVYVFERDTSGTWTEAPKLLASDGSDFDQLGVSVGISGDALVAGAIFDDAAGPLSGSAYVFERSDGGVWLEAAKLVPSDASDSDLFGGSVAISGDRLVVGAYLDDPAGADSGSAYVYERDGTGVWREVAKLVPSDGARGDQFGISVAMSGARLVVGAYLDDGPGRDSGSAYVFERDAAGAWIESAKLVASDGSADDRFGLSVGISGRRLVAGAYLDDAAGVDSGSAYVFERRAGTWTEAAKLSPADAAPNDLFGFSVGVRGRRIVVGALLDDAVAADAGSAYLFRRDASGEWTEVSELTASDGAGGDAFGVSTAIGGGRVVIGASGDDGARGSTYLFERSAPAVMRRE